MASQCHSMPEKDQDAQEAVRNRISVHPCIWQLRVVRSTCILEGNDVITIAPTGMGKSLTFWMPLLFTEKSVMILVVLLKTLGSQFADKLNEKLKMPAVIVTKNITDDVLFLEHSQVEVSHHNLQPRNHSQQSKF
ncbi:hypothetical protein Moror_12395 [Moniliophthora roreri MCA 2997]|uniref:DEAD/DEAH-box helicase domain-containing protein n=1 Tax=Moniliophthora roreri (strain MCA 2997) TaxID=1381753 RepID=V2X9D1_MONRO|nr:hypothetical protein Moror_12395 [Moniliophthora roreri MCA 2997]